MGTWVQMKIWDESSDWKELHTLVEFLRREVRRPKSHFQNRRIFYFTDNTTAYDVCQKGKFGLEGLHKMVREMKHLCATMNCLLKVIHIPSREIINQGSDNLSQGLWQFGGYLQDAWKLPNLLRPVEMDPAEGLSWLLQLAQEKAAYPQEVSQLPTGLKHWRIVRDLDRWDPEAFLKRHAILLTSPSLT